MVEIDIARHIDFATAIGSNTGGNSDGVPSYPNIGQLYLVATTRVEVELPGRQLVLTIGGVPSNSGTLSVTP